MNNPIFTIEQLRMVAGVVLSCIASVMLPIKGLYTMLTLLCCFNVFCGMRADGVSVTHCRQFRFGKFWKAIAELGLYVLIVTIIHRSMAAAGDEEQAYTVAKVMAYIFSYVYLQNAFKNLVKTYPTNKGIWFIYYFVRFEFTKMLPKHIGEVVDRISRAEKQQESNPKQEEEEQ